MRRTLLALGLTALLAPAARAQDSTAAGGRWAFSTDAILAFAQSAFSTNWSGGDRGAVVWTIGTDSKLERAFGTTFNLSNHLVLAYGQTAKQEIDPNDPRQRVWDTPQKSTDAIMLESVGRWTLNRFIDPYVSFRLDSQFFDQSNPLGDQTFNPIKLKEAAGAARVVQKTKTAELITRVGFGFRQTLGRTFVLDPALRAVRFSSNDGGFEWQTTSTQTILGTKVMWKSSLLVFQPVFFSGSEALASFDDAVAAGDTSRPAEPGVEAVADFWKAADVDVQNAFTAEITKSIGVGLFVRLVYDKFDTAANVDQALPLAVLVPEVRRNVRKAGQFKQTLALTLNYKFF